MKLSQIIPKLRRNSEMGTVDGEHGILTGQTRFGKTYLAKRIMRFFPYAIVHDPKDRFTTGWAGEHRIHHVEELASLNLQEHPWVIYAPARDEREDPRAREAYCAEILKRGRCLALFDELNRIAESPTVYPPSFRYLYTSGAEDAICVLGLTQEPIRLPSFTLTQAAHHYIFYIGNSSHRDKIAGFMPLDDEEAIKDLERYEFLYWRNDMRDVTGPWWLEPPEGG